MTYVKLCDMVQINLGTPFPWDCTNTQKNSVLPTVCYTKVTVNISEVSVAFFHSLKHNLLQTRRSFKSVILCVHQNCQWNNTCL